MSKKIISLFLSLMLVVASLSVTILSVSAASEDSTFVVAGVSALCGSEWDGSPATSPDNVMTAKGDGTYEKVFTDVQPGKALTFKVVENAADGTQTWYGPNGDNSPTADNVKINVNAACDVTVTFDAATNLIGVTGDAVTIPQGLEIEDMYAVGNGSGGFLNDVAWDPADEENIMTEVSPNVYQITFDEVEIYSGYEFKFAANGSWADQWGAVETGFTAPLNETFAVTKNSNTANIKLNLGDTEELEYVKVTLTLDLSNFDVTTSEGGTCRVDVESLQEPTEATTEAPTEAPTEEPTEAPTEEPTKADGAYLTVNATSNYFPAYTQEFNEDTKEVTVTYYIDPSKNVLDVEWYLTYDPEVLTLSKSKSVYCPVMMDAATLKTSDPGAINFNATSLRLFDFTTNDGPQIFASVTFDVKDISAVAPVTTTVDLDVQVLRFSMVQDPEDPFSQTDEAQEVLFIRDGVVNTAVLDDPASGLTVTATTDIPASPEPTEEPTQAPTEEPTQAPTEEPTEEPTQAPTEEPTQAPTEEPTEEPTQAPTEEPTEEPTQAPTEEPTEEPTQAPTEEPTEEPTQAPTDVEPTEAPTDVEPTEAPTEAPTETPNATSATNGGTSTGDTPTGGTTGTANGSAVQTGDASLAVVILSILVAATGVMFVLRKREMF